MPGPERLEALVVGGADAGEADRVVHLLSSQGRLSVFAPQAKRSRRRFAGALEPFNTIRAQLAARKTSHGMLTLSDAVVCRARLSLRRSLDEIALASYFAELGFRTAPEGQRSEVAALVEAGWEYLADEPASRRARRAFELKLMAELGYHPELDGCVVCGAADDAHAHLDFGRGGRLCGTHAAGATRLGPKTTIWLRAVLATSSLDPDGGVDPDWADTAAMKVAGPASAFWAQLLERPLKAASLLSDVGL